MLRIFSKILALRYQMFRVNKKKFTFLTPETEWRRLDRGPKHGIINDSYGVHEEEMIMFEMNGTKVNSNLKALVESI